MGSHSHRRSRLAGELERLIALLVDEQDEVRIHEHRQGRTTSFRVRVAEADLGKLIGRQGRTARALRSLVAVRGSLDRRRYNIEIRES